MLLKSVAEGDLAESPLVGLLTWLPDQINLILFQLVILLKGQTLVIIEAMKVMKEIPAPKDGVVTEILVENEEMVEFGKAWYVSND